MLPQALPRLRGRAGWGLAHRRRHGRAAGSAGAAADLGRRRAGPGMAPHAAVLGWIERVLAAGGGGLRRGRDRRACSPGSTAASSRPARAGAPSRGRPEVLPTGRNFYSVDTRAVPTPAAWQLGWHSAGLLVERYAQEHGNYPARLALSAWGTANMRTGGDDIAQALALIGVRPVWEGASGRVTGFEILPASVLDRPRVDVTLAHLRLFPRRLSRPDRPVRQRGARRRGARRAGRRPTRSPPASPPIGRRSKPPAPRPTRPRAAPATASSAPSRGPTAPGCRP